MQLRRTRRLHFSKLSAMDDVTNAPSYDEATFLREIPRLYAELEHELGSHPVHGFLRMGQWIGGDRDGSPNVGAQTLAYALRRWAEVAERHRLTEVRLLGGELSLSAMLVRTHSAHWLAHPAFSDAVERFLAREGEDVENHLKHQ